ncbi:MULTISPECIES: DUF438 domain-containing protein [Enterococcus]|uniref:Histidine kinase n=1 Tax=Enterococcus thailandicus TaxID=417368 RepID=A0A179EU95_ENTTH|nr:MULTISPECIES: DUF438 domain-containing protein [Enterococcus]ASZ06686.1 DUF438 domain-containing protein [Enterococcus thailandicus]MDA3966056.1 DUF438 domain-containing protein [Enterococcus thailandicus]MDT2795010.1 DUF438 domain-containing protein [Enterococcus thailandicus]OAQ56774.1 histidine kinase [Enterococcus thailandicus]OTP22669.1 hypothetical protein A5800_000481 [Enterococcus sp. 5B7_DIV0075]
MERTRQQRQERIVEILTLLHEGGSFEAAKELFNQEFDGVDVTEITAAEKALIQSGLNPQEIQRLCNIHAAVFKGSINEIHRSNLEHEQPGHPIHTLKLENQVLQSLLTDEIDDLLLKIKAGDWTQKERLLKALKDLRQIDKHYARKETLIFSYMEKYGISAPPKVMWGVDDDIRDMVKALIQLAEDERAAYNPIATKWEETKNEIEEMIFKEEEIMAPMTLDVFSLSDWEKIAADSFDIGFAFIPEPLPWKPSQEALEKESEREPARQLAIQQAKATTDGIAESLLNETDSVPVFVEKQDKAEMKEVSEPIVLPTGTLKLEQMIAMFQVLPVDLTFVDNDDRVRFFSEGKERVFPRTTSVIGREVVNCHPPKSMHIVQQILDDFRSGARSEAEFWIDMRGKKIYIRYFALRNEADDYLGCLEVTQDVTPIQSLEGQKRLLD